MSSIDPTKDDKILVDELMNLPSSLQAEKIADSFSVISNLYEPLKAEDIHIPNIEDSKACPLFEPHEKEGINSDWGHSMENHFGIFS